MSWLDYDDADEDFVGRDTPLEPEADGFLINRKPDGWQTKAACLGSDVALFFPDRGTSAAPAKAICATCPMDARIGCLNEVLDLGYREHGIRAGLTRDERRGMQTMDRDAVIAAYKARALVAVDLPVPRTRTRKVPQCGTYSGYRRHQKDNETPCPACTDAKREYKRVYMATRRALTVIDGGAA